MSERLPPTHILTIEVPLRLIEHEPRSLGAVMEIVRLAYPSEICDDVQLTIRPADNANWFGEWDGRDVD